LSASCSQAAMAAAMTVSLAMADGGWQCSPVQRTTLGNQQGTLKEFMAHLLPLPSHCKRRMAIHQTRKLKKKAKRCQTLIFV